jgi:hypothetical protein
MCIVLSANNISFLLTSSVPRTQRSPPEGEQQEFYVFYPIFYYFLTLGERRPFNVALWVFWKSHVYSNQKPKNISSKTRPEPTQKFLINLYFEAPCKDEAKAL